MHCLCMHCLCMHCLLALSPAGWPQALRAGVPTVLSLHLCAAPPPRPQSKASPDAAAARHLPNRQAVADVWPLVEPLLSGDLSRIAKHKGEAPALPALPAALCLLCRHASAAAAAHCCPASAAFQPVLPVPIPCPAQPSCWRRRSTFSARRPRWSPARRPPGADWRPLPRRCCPVQSWTASRAAAAAAATPCSTCCSWRRARARRRQPQPGTSSGRRAARRATRRKARRASRRRAATGQRRQ